jgi:ribosomal protein S18 acetylase RimI-like enzyme
VNIRILRRSDAAVFQAHRLGALQESPEAFGSTYEEDLPLSLDVVADRIEESTVAPRRVVFGAFEGDTLLGFVGCMQEHKVKARHKAFIWGTYVHPDARGNGVGTALLSQLIAYTSGWEYVQRLTLTVVDSARAARALYYSAGFESFGREPDGLRQDGRSETVEYLALRLRKTAIPSPTGN